MSNYFHDDAIKFIVDIISSLQNQSVQSRTGEDAVGKETIISSLLREIGVTQSAGLQVNDDVNHKESVATPKINDLFNNYFKVMTGTREAELIELNRLLKAFRTRLLRYGKTKQQIKLNRTSLLIDSPNNPIDTSKLIKDSVFQTRIEIAKKQKELKVAGDLKGILNQDIALQTALKMAVNNSIKIPEDIEGFRNQLVRFLSADGKDAADRVEKLNQRKQEIQNEVNRLQNAEDLLFNGVEISGQKISLINIIDLLIFLTDRKRLHYNCSECKNFRTGKVKACIFAGKGSTSLTQLITIKDPITGEQMVGRLTEPTNSCKQVWDLEGNDFYVPSDSVNKTIDDIIKG